MKTRVYKGQERRRQKRVTAALPLKITYDNTRITSKTKNISMLGACIESDVQITPDTQLRIQVGIPRQAKRISGRIECEGTIVRCQPFSSAGAQRYELNIFFTKFLEKHGEARLYRLIEYLIQKQEKNLQKEFEKYKQRMAERKRRIMLKRLARLRRRRRRKLKKQRAKNKAKK